MPALLVGQVVLQHVGQDGPLRIIGNLPGHQQAELLHGHEDVVRQGVAGAVAGLPDAGDQGVDVVQDLVRGLVRPAGAVSGAHRRGAHPGDDPVVDQAGGIHLVEAPVHRAVDGLVAVQPDALVQEGLRIPAHADHLLPLQGGESLIRGSDTKTKKCTPGGAKGVQKFRGGAESH